MTPQKGYRSTCWFVNVILGIIKDPGQQILIGDWQLASNGKGQIESDKYVKLADTYIEQDANRKSKCRGRHLEPCYMVIIACYQDIYSAITLIDHLRSRHRVRLSASTYWSLSFVPNTTRIVNMLPFQITSVSECANSLRRSFSFLPSAKVG